MRTGIRPRIAELISAVTLCVALTGPGAAAAAPFAYPADRVEAVYSQPGPWAVAVRHGIDCCDSSGDHFDIWYPAELDQGRVRHPIITWGDGTWAHPGRYAYLLSHLASWGFVVIAADNTETGSGRQMMDAARYLVQRDADVAGPFYRKLNTHAIGAMGHSQGASGALNALGQSDGEITTAVTVELARQQFCVALAAICVDPKRITSGSVFLVNGSADNVISPSTQSTPWQTTGVQSDQAYYQALPASVTKVWATLNGPNHNDVQGQPNCASGSFPCTTGVYGYLGYPTAWFMDQLCGDARAHRAFLARTGELFVDNVNWSNQSSNITR